MATTAADRLFVDTNTLIYATNPGSLFRAAARARLAFARAAGTELWISPQIVREFLSVTTRGVSALTRTEALRFARFFLRYFRIAEKQAATTERLIELAKQFPHIVGKLVHDANIVATCLVHGIPRLLTQNVNDFKPFAGLIAIEALVIATAP